MISKFQLNFFSLLRIAGVPARSTVLPIIIILICRGFSPEAGILMLRVYIFFIQSREGKNCLVVPLVSIVSRILHYKNNEKAIGTIVPYLPSPSSGRSLSQSISASF